MEVAGKDRLGNIIPNVPVDQLLFSPVASVFVVRSYLVAGQHNSSQEPQAESNTERCSEIDMQLFTRIIVQSNLTRKCFTSSNHVCQLEFV